MQRGDKIKLTHKDGSVLFGMVEQEAPVRIKTTADSTSRLPVEYESLGWHIEVTEYAAPPKEPTPQAVIKQPIKVAAYRDLYLAPDGREWHYVGFENAYTWRELIAHGGQEFVILSEPNAY